MLECKQEKSGWTDRHQQTVSGKNSSLSTLYSGELKKKKKIGICRLGDATYQISKLYTFQFPGRRILKFSFLVPKFKLCDPQGRSKF